MNKTKAKMKSNYNLLESSYSTLESSYRMLEFDSGNALLNNDYTKHYFTEGERICSKIGGGFSNPNIDIHHHVESEMPYEEQITQAEIGVEKTFDVCMDEDVLTNTLTDKIFNAMNYELQRNDPEPAFFYLTDHLGSSSYITDASGNITQAFVYMPFGEQLVDLQYGNPSYTTPYKFNGKEKDEETGFTYFGGRYYIGEKVPQWASVDPMAHKYPHLSSYVYCANNPVKYIDPNGMEIDPASREEWDKQRQAITDKKNSLSKLSIRNIMLGLTLKRMDYMEMSKQVYTLNKIEGNVGETFFDVGDDKIHIDFTNTANFVHEVTHAYQFEKNEIFFDLVSGKGVVDYWDEFEAYRMQEAYDSKSIPNKSSRYPLFTKEWLLEIKSEDKSVYSRHGQYPINGNSGAFEMNKAYPNQNWDFMGNNRMRKYGGSFKFSH